MRILHVPLNYVPSTGGLQTLFQEVTDRLVRDHGDVVEVWTVNALQNPAQPFSPKAGPARDEVRGVVVRRFARARRTQWVIQRTLAVATQVGALPASRAPTLRLGPVVPTLPAALVRARPDVICVGPVGYLHVPCVLWCQRRTDVPVVLVGALHLGPEELIPPHVVRAIRRADAYIALTSYEAQVVVRHGIDSEKVIVARPGIGSSESPLNRTAARRALGLPSGPIVGFVGRKAPYKGLLTLLGAMERVWNGLPAATLVIAGPDTRYSEVVRSRVEALPPPVRDRVVVLGEINEAEKANVFAGSDVVVNVSTEESFGIVFLEAWQAGTPVIGADIGVTRDVVTSGVDGLLVAPNDPVALSEALLRVIDDPAMRDRLALYGRRKAEGSRWESTAEAWRAACALAAQRRRGAPAAAEPR